MGSDKTADAGLLVFPVFQSTLPAWGATSSINHKCHTDLRFNPRSPHGERPPVRAISKVTSTCFNPRSPHGERPQGTGYHSGAYGFQSTLPAWGATCIVIDCVSVRFGFNPRSPHGERPVAPGLSRQSGMFQSTLPAWGATLPQCQYHQWLSVSIHAPRMGSDASRRDIANLYGLFQSTLPAWGATTYLPAR